MISFHTYKNRSILWLCCGQNTPGSSRCQSLPAGRPTTGHTWAQTPGAPWTGPTRTYNKHTQKKNRSSQRPLKKPWGGAGTQALTAKIRREGRHPKKHMQTNAWCWSRASPWQPSPHRRGRMSHRQITMETLPLDEEVCARLWFWELYTFIRGSFQRLRASRESIQTPVEAQNPSHPPLTCALVTVDRVALILVFAAVLFFFNQLQIMWKRLFKLHVSSSWVIDLSKEEPPWTALTGSFLSIVL